MPSTMYSPVPPSPLRSSGTRLRANSEATSRVFHDLNTRPDADADTQASFLSSGIPTPYGGWSSQLDDGTLATSGFGFYPSPLPSPTPMDEHDPLMNSHLNPLSHLNSPLLSKPSRSRTQAFFSTDHKAPAAPPTLLNDKAVGQRDTFDPSGTMGGLNRARSMNENRRSQAYDEGEPAAGLFRCSSLKKNQTLEQNGNPNPNQGLKQDQEDSASPKSNDLFKTSFAVAPPPKISSDLDLDLDSPSILSPLSPTFAIASNASSSSLSSGSFVSLGRPSTFDRGQFRSVTMPTRSATISARSPKAGINGHQQNHLLSPMTRVPTLLPSSPNDAAGFSAFPSQPQSPTFPTPINISDLQTSSPSTTSPSRRILTREPSNTAQCRPIRPGFEIGPQGDDQPEQGRRFLLTKMMGEGAFSVVWEARENTSLVAIKMMDRRMCRENDRTRISFLREVAVLKQISHPHVVSYISSFWTPDYNCLVLEHLSGGELFDLMQQPGNHKRLTEPLMRRIFTELCRGINWLHTAGIVHRDIKLENIMFTVNPFTSDVLPSSPLVKITDFGLSRFIDQASPLLRTRCGSESFAAPEIVMGQPYDGRKTDAWATGVLLFTLISGELPFDNAASSDDSSSRRRRMMRIARGVYEWPSGLGSEEVRQVVARLIVRDPSRRSSIDRQLWNEPWMQGEGAVPPPDVYEPTESIDGKKRILDGFLLEDSADDLSRQEIP